MNSNIFDLYSTTTRSFLLWKSMLLIKQKKHYSVF